MTRNFVKRLQFFNNLGSFFEKEQKKKNVEAFATIVGGETLSMTLTNCFSTGGVPRF